MARQGEGGSVMSAREFIDGTVTEAQFQHQVVDLARVHKWTTYHTFDSRKSTAGFPDLVMVRNSRLIFAELKSAKGKLSADQEWWIALLDDVAGQAGKAVEVFIWRPENWAEIKATLA